MEITFAFACRDDCLDILLASDLRRLVAERDSLRADNAQGQKDYCALMERHDNQRNEIERLRAVVEAADQWSRARTFEDQQAHLCRLQRALRLLPNAPDNRAP
jgi:hypothetical protein